jgi:hypothetical protein
MAPWGHWLPGRVRGVGEKRRCLYIAHDAVIERNSRKATGPYASAGTRMLLARRNQPTRNEADCDRWIPLIAD